MDDDFVPEGRVPLRSAIQRAAEARQANVTSLQIEFRTKLHDGSISAEAMDRTTGRILGITPDAWGTETALNWLENGTCLLPNENGKVRITTERFDMFYGPEKATIFILESDLQGLIGPANKRDARRPVTSDAEARRHFEEWRQQRGSDVPSLKEDVDFMRQFGVSRDKVRKLRKSTGVDNRSRGRSRQTAPK